jgi:hypothetical protein
MRTAWLLVLVLASMPEAARADEPPPAWQRDLQDGADRLRQGLDKALEQALGSLDAWARALPQYEMPRLNENGDIIIRRKRPDEPDGGQGKSI